VLRTLSDLQDRKTLRILHNRHSARIRLNGIDCPEKGQANGKRAKQAASALAFGENVTTKTHGHDKYKRVLGDVILPDGMNLNQELLKQGWGWWYRKYAPGIRYSKGWSRKYERREEGCGLILSRCRRGNGGRGAFQAATRGKATRCRRTMNCR